MKTLIGSGTSMWDPLVLVIAFALILLLVYLVRATGNKRYAKGTAQTKPFWSGNVKEPEGSMGPDSVYWGFMDAFSALWKPLSRMHTGITNDYVGAFVVVLAIFLLIILIL